MRKITIKCKVLIMRILAGIKRLLKKSRALSMKPIALVKALRKSGKRVIYCGNNKGQRNVYRCVFADGSSHVYAVNMRENRATMLF